ncbi:MAG: hypothetical protein DRJ51_05190 [Thermoprotei archaeon]|nr:MAG: hypothetical protein DRJ51_05190 [Thermoprotei archaeon]RLE81423.1 MAG: hypothetical protein DRJ36_01325 [Thermoprotei archaeon]
MTPRKIVFVVKSNTAVTAPTFSPRSPASSGGRLDVMLRSIIVALLDPSGVRRHVDFYAILGGPPNPPITLHFIGEDIAEMPFSENELAKIVLKVLRGDKIRGVELLKKDLIDCIKDLIREGYKLYYMHEKGKLIDCSYLRNPAKVGFILGDQQGLNTADERALKSMQIEMLSLGRTAYLTSICVTAILYLLYRCL